MKQSSHEQTNHHRETRPLLLAALLCLLSLALMCAALTLPRREATPAAFVPPPFEALAVQGSPAVPDGLGWGEVDAQAFRASICGAVTVADGQAQVWLTNPAESTVWLKLRVLDAQGRILGETGLLRPGEYVRTVALNKPLRPGEHIGLKLMAYEPDTYYSAGSAVLNTTVVGE